MKRYTKIGLSTLLVMTLLASAFLFVAEGSDADEEMTRASTLCVGSDQTYKTIKSAMSAASSGDTIRIYNGTYHEPLTISKSLTFQGNGSSSTIINQTTNKVTWWITAPDVMIKDIAFEANRSIDNFAIKTDGFNTSGSRITIQRCTFSDSSQGIAFPVADGNKVLDSFIFGGGISFQYSKNNMVKNTSIYGGGIFTHSTNYNLIEDCVLTSGPWEQYSSITVGGDNNMVKDCLVYDQKHPGIQINGDSNIIIHNTLVNNEWGGISISSSHRNWISNNTIKGNGENGIRAFGCSNNTFRYNNIEDNSEYGIKFEYSAWDMKDNEIAFNNFKNNGGQDAQAFDTNEGNSWYTMNGGNYWSDHSNTDTNKDFFADADYRLAGVGGARDRKPFASPLVFPNPPEITTTDITTAYTNQNYSVQYGVFDWDTHSSNLFWSLNTNASWLTFTSSQELKGIPNVSTSSYWVNISVSDGEFTDFTNFTLNVINPNVAPAILTADVPICYEDEPYEVDYDAEDTDDLIWTLNTDAPFLSMDEETGILSGTPNNDDVGTYTVSIVVRDQWSQDSTEFSLEVINTNDAPVITTEDVLTVHEGELYLVQYFADDIDQTGDDLIWTMLTNCPFLNMDPDTGYLTGSPGETDAGIYLVNISVSDGNGGMDRRVFDLEVIKVNNAPSAVKDVWMIEMDEDSTDSSLNVNSMFTDIDGDTLQYTISEHDKVSWDLNEDGVVTFEPLADWIGFATITITANDGEFTTSSAITIEVKNTNDPPFDPVIDTGSVEYKENETQTVSASAMDIDPDEILTYEWSIIGMGIIGSGETIDLNLLTGNYTLILKVTDSSGSSTTTTMQIEVLPKDDIAPSANPSSEKASILPYLIVAALLLVMIAFVLSFFVIRNRNKKLENNRDGINAWNQTLSFEPSPTPKKGMVPGPETTSEMHRLAADRGLAHKGHAVNGGRLGSSDEKVNFEDSPEVDEGSMYLSKMMEEVLSSDESLPSTTSLREGLDRAHDAGEIPQREYSEIKRRLNNIDK